MLILALLRNASRRRATHPTHPYTLRMAAKYERAMERLARVAAAKVGGRDHRGERRRQLELAERCRLAKRAALSMAAELERRGLRPWRVPGWPGRLP